MREVSNHQDLQRHITTKEMIRLFMGAQLCTIAQLCTKLCTIVLSPYLMKYLDPSNVMGVQLVQKGLLINNFKVTSINKQVVPTIVKLCRIVHRIVHDCALTVSHEIFVPIQCYGCLFSVEWPTY